jgi:hypothetical protein
MMFMYQTKILRHSALPAPTTGDVQCFFDDFHAHLRKQGVDFVKGDEQVSFDLVTDGRSSDGEYVLRKHQIGIRSALAMTVGTVVFVIDGAQPKLYY